FIGKATGAKARFLLLYPTAAPPRKKDAPSLAEALAERNAWQEVPITIDFSKAERTEGRVARLAKAIPGANDLEGRWAVDQAVAFAILEWQTPEFGFYGLAREALGRRYDVPVLPFRSGWAVPERAHLQLYEITTGATAIAESLALDRFRNPRKSDKPEARNHDVTKLPAVTVAEHDWVKMMAGKKPSAEPLAGMVPHDNYFIHFKHYGKFLELLDLVNEVGMSVGRAMSVQSREYHLKENIERQLCLKNTGLAKLLGPTVIKSLVITGSDPYIREGSDLTLLFQTKNKAFFLSGVQPHIEEARRLWGKQLKEEKREHRGVAIESFVTRLREVSLFRAVIDDVVVYSNSPAGVRRVIDAHQGKTKRLSESLDFQYMRTVFRFDDPAEDGFLFLSDPFIRNLVGPALRIKERRRLEALTSLYMLTNGALFTAWETGALPRHHKELLARASIRQEELVTPEGGPVFWDTERKVAISDAYNTIRFATPLIELPIDFVTDREASEYEEFRRQYLGLWTRTFDPIGMRFSLRGKEIQWDTFVLPLVQISQYAQLRRWAGGEGIALNSDVFSDKTVIQFLAYFSKQAHDDVRGLFTHLGGGAPKERALGDWVMLRLDDSPAFKKWVEMKIAAEVSGSPSYWAMEKGLLEMPFTFGVEVVNRKAFTEGLSRLRGKIEESPQLRFETLKKPYRGVEIGKITEKDRDDFPPLFHALIDDAWYLSLSEKSLHDIVDRSILRKEGKIRKGKEAAAVNTVLYIAPAAMREFKAGARLYLEYEAHRTALGNSYLWLPLYRSGLVSAKSSAAERKDAAMRFLGYEPISPDLAPDFYDARTGEVVNKRHGSPRKPALADGVDPDSPLGKLLENFEMIRADMRFREDGLHAAVVIRRK
ncbi:MAG: hypothetical protein U0793_24495, partial [Gemmataceae bacterium]